MTPAEYQLLSPADAYRLAVERRAAGRLEDAKQILQRVTAAAPHQPDALSLLGLVSAELGQYEEAEKHLLGAVGKKKSNPKLHFNLGYGRLLAGDHDGAIKAFRVVLSIKPDDAAALANLGNAQNLSQRFDEAEVSYRRVLELAPGDVAAMVSLGSILETTGKYAAARDVLAGAVAIAPDDAVLHLRLGSVLMDLRENDAAAAHCARAIALAPGLAQAHAMMANLLLRLNRFGASLRAADACLGLAPANTYALAYKLLALSQIGPAAEYAVLADFSLARPHLVPAPPGYADLAAFNRALVRHIRNHPRLFSFDDFEVTHNGKEIKDILEEPKGPAGVWEGLISDLVAAYIADLPAGSGNPMLAHPPKHWHLSAWANVLGGTGYQEAHIHGNAWLSGVYYVHLPKEIHPGNESKAGWIEFGPPEHNFTLPDRRRSHWFTPEEGKAILFPSYFYHRTLPTRGTDDRIAIAFDVIPGPAGQS